MITVVFGKPRVGKTAYMVAHMIPLLNRSEADLQLTQVCREQIQRINEGGFRFEEPTHAPVYSNFPVKVPIGYQRVVGSYYVDGYRMGFENDDVETLPLLPYSVVFLSEVQRYYNSKSGFLLPDWVSRFYEEHGHFHLTIWMDCQRPMLIDKNIRDLVDRFVYIEKMQNLVDTTGNIVRSAWSTYVFDDWKYAEEFVEHGETVHGIQEIFEFDGNVFEYYDSTCYYNEFIPASGFVTLQHIYGVTSEKELRLSKCMYSQSAPEGYWQKRGKG